MKPGKLLTCFFVLACAAAPAFAQGPAGQAPAPGSKTDVEAIRKASAEFGPLYVKGDAKGLAALYTEDAVLLPPGLEPVRGREAIERFWERRPPGLAITSYEASPGEVEVAGDLAYLHGTWKFAGTQEGKPLPPISGKHLLVWRRGTDGRWRMHVDMWNMDPPPPGQ